MGIVLVDGHPDLDEGVVQVTALGQNLGLAEVDVRLENALDHLALAWRATARFQLTLILLPTMAIAQRLVRPVHVLDQFGRVLAQRGQLRR